MAGRSLCSPQNHKNSNCKQVLQPSKIEFLTIHFVMLKSNPFRIPIRGRPSSLLRVISGKLKGKKLFSVKGVSLRPTSDRVKESIFDILQECFKGEKVLDLFAGTGALGIEALSRGAEKAVFVEGSTRSREALRKNLDACHLEEQAEVIAREVREGIKFLEKRRESFAIVFLDPPYGKGLAHGTLAELAKSSLLLPGTLVVAEHSPDEEVDSLPSLPRIDQRRYGGTRISFYRYEGRHSHSE